MNFKEILINFNKFLDPLIKNFISRVPISVDAEIENVICGAESFTPDTKMIMGESAEVAVEKIKELFKKFI